MTRAGADWCGAGSENPAAWEKAYCKPNNGSSERTGKLLTLQRVGDVFTLFGTPHDIFIRTPGVSVQGSLPSVGALYVEADPGCYVSYGMVGGP